MLRFISPELEPESDPELESELMARLKSNFDSDLFNNLLFTLLLCIFWNENVMLTHKYYKKFVIKLLNELTFIIYTMTHNCY